MGVPQRYLIHTCDIFAPCLLFSGLLLKISKYMITTGAYGSLPIPRPARASHPTTSHSAPASSDRELRRQSRGRWRYGGLLVP